MNAKDFPNADEKVFDAPSIFAIGRWVCRVVLADFFNHEIYGEENIPKSGGVLIASNHVSFLDPPAVAGSAPRNCYSFARKTLFKTGFSGWVFRQFLTIPVDRDGGNDLGAIKTVLKRLKEGQAVLLFPEGTRSEDGKLQEAKRGAGMLAAMSQVPIVPTRVFGTFEAWNRHMKNPCAFRPTAVVYGKPIFPEEYDPGKTHPERYQEISSLIMERIGALKDPRR